MDESVGKISYDNIGGVREQLVQIKKMVELSLKHPQLLKKMALNHHEVFFFTDHQAQV